MSSDPNGAHRPELDEDVEIELDRRRYLFDAYAQLATITHYALLGVARTADEKAIKNAYYRLSGLVHPDRYFGKRLGSYKPKLEAIFTQLSVAYEVLSSPEKREQYDADLDEAAAHRTPGETQAAAPVDPRLVAKRQAALALLKETFAAGKAKAQHYVDAAVRARASGDIAAAADAYRSALTYAANDPDIKRAYEETQQAASAKLGESHIRKAMLEERFGRWAAAAESWQRAMAVKPNDPEVHARLANAMARARGEPA